MNTHRIRGLVLDNGLVSDGIEKALAQNVRGVRNMDASSQAVAG